MIQADYPQHLVRLLAEVNMEREKTEALEKFTQSPKFGELLEVQREMLNQQLNIMKAFVHVLTVRAELEECLAQKDLQIEEWRDGR